MGLVNGGFEQVFADWEIVSGGCLFQSWTVFSNPTEAHSGTYYAQATARRTSQGGLTCGTLRQVLTGLVAGDARHSISGFWRSVQVSGLDGGSVVFKIDGLEIGRLDALQGPYVEFAFPFTPAGSTAVLDIQVVPPPFAVEWRQYLFDDLSLHAPPRALHAEGAAMGAQPITAKDLPFLAVSARGLGCKTSALSLSDESDVEAIQVGIVEGGEA